MGLSDGLHRRCDGRREVALLTQASLPHPDPLGGTQQVAQTGPYRRVAFEELGSTNDEAMARLRAGDPGGLFVTAARQSGGRGRQGRAWASPVGNLYASLALRLTVPPAVAPQLGFVAGVALAKMLRQRLGGDDRLKIKWPNDMIFAGAKLAGLLLESTMLATSEIGCVVGFGVNCRSHPDHLPYPATDLAACGDPSPDPDSLLPALATAMARQIARWEHAARFDEIRSDWLAFSVDLGTPLAVALPDRRIAGTFQGLDSIGRLLLGTAGGRVAIDAGDVFLPEMAEFCK